MRVCLYGDSYVDPRIINPNTNSWITQLQHDYPNLENYGCSGTGPDYSLSLLDQHGGDFIIFFTGFPDRLPWYQLDNPGHQVDISDIYYRENGSNGRLKRHSNDLFRQYCLDHYHNIKFTYKTFKQHILKKTEYTVGYLRNYADIHSSLVIAILQGNPYSTFLSPSLRLTYIPEAIRTTLKTKHFTLYDYNIASVSRNEMRNFSRITHTPKNDRRQNHLTQPNHDILYQNICSILQHDPLQDHVYDQAPQDEYIGNEDSSFIYDN